MIGYFYIDKNTNQQHGPFNIDELKSKKITSDTMIWFSGLPDWVEAGKIPALGFLFGNPQTNTQQSAPQQQQQARPATPQQSMYQSNVYGQYGAPRRDNNVEVRPMPKSWLIESVLATVFCIHVFGVVAIIYASKVESAYYAGDYETSEDSSKKAKMWLFIGLGIMAAGFLILILFYAFIIIAAVASEGASY